MTRRHAALATALLMPGVLGFDACARGPVAPAHAPASPAPAVEVSGNRLVTAEGTPVRLLGVNRAGTEFACVEGWGIFDGPSDARSIAAMTAWHINAVRIPLNEDCWLGINGVKPQFSGAAYQQAIEGYVAELHQEGLAVILDLHWAAPGAVLAARQLPMPDLDHAPAFWASVARAFRRDGQVVFDLFNEPFVDTTNADTKDPWDCWLNGCSIDPGLGLTTRWRAAGMQSLVDAVRGAGARQPILLGGLGYAGDLTGWLHHRPRDPSHQLAASVHVYNFARCSAQDCWSSELAPVAAAVPVVAGELGENDCAGAFIDSFMSWADGHGVSYLGWAWDTWNCEGGPALISSYAGSPTSFGAALRAHLAALAAPTFAA